MAPRILIAFPPGEPAAAALALALRAAQEELGGHVELASTDAGADASSYDAVILAVRHPDLRTRQHAALFLRENWLTLTATPFAVAGICTHRRVPVSTVCQSHGDEFQRQLRAVLRRLRPEDARLFASAAEPFSIASRLAEPELLRRWVRELGFHRLAAAASPVLELAPADDLHA